MSATTLEKEGRTYEDLEMFLAYKRYKQRKFGQKSSWN